MRSRHLRLGAFLVSCLLGLLISAARAEVTVPPLFGDHMVIQRGLPINIWGDASPGEHVTVTLGDTSEKATAGENGQWKVTLPARGDGKLEMTIEGSSTGRPIKIADVLVGDVWVCSGQSNMAFPLARANNAQSEMASANDSQLRLFHVQRTPSLEPTRQLKGQWELCSPQTVPGFSAVGYFFGRELRRTRPEVPVGLIESDWGGMPAEAFTSLATLESDPDFQPMLDRKKEAGENLDAQRQDYVGKARAWQKRAFGAAEPPDEQFTGAFSGDGWKTVTLPSATNSAGADVDGVFWLRREVNVPEVLAGRDMTLSLGPIDDFDETFFNGEKVGATGADNPLAMFADREYRVPGKLVQGGKNVIAVRVFDAAGPGGMTGKAEQMFLAPAGPEAIGPIHLEGEWSLKVEREINARSLPKRPAYPEGSAAARMPSNLFNGQIYPLIPYGIKGVIWYQGESNAPRAEQYRKLFPAMIEDWRKAWNQPEAAGQFPFLFVQLANFRKPATEPADSDWAELREAQTMTLDKSKNTGMAVIVDIGEANDIHPKNKQDVGKRLALAAEHVAYGRNDLVWSSPMYESGSMKVEDGKAHLKFDHAGDGLLARGGDLKGFAVAGEDHKFHWADAKIDGKDTVIVWSKDVPNPTAVRYAWGDNPEGANLYNSAGLPACPFRTDDLPLITAGKK